MKSVLQNVKTGDLSVEDIPPPVLKPGNVLVRNEFSLVSAGTEKAVLEFSNAGYLRKARMRPDLFRKVLMKAKNDGLYQTYKVVSELIEQKIQLGYSSSGVVEAVGEHIQDIHVGQNVACAGLFAATHSEVVCVPRNLVVQVPDGVRMEDASFVALGAIAMQGIRLANLSLGENVIVYGLGLVGAITAQMALAAGCRVIGADIDKRKTDKIEELGATGVLIDEGFNATIMKLTEGYGADKVLLCAATKSNEPVEKIPSVMRQKGVMVVVGDVGMNIPRRDYFEKEIDIRISRSYGPGRYDMSYEQSGLDYPYGYVRWTENRNMAATLDLLSRGSLDFSRLVTHRFDIKDAMGAYDLITAKNPEPYSGITLRYPDRSVDRTIRLAEPAGTSGQPLDAVNFGIIGAGDFGKAFLLPAFARQDGIRYVGICTASGVSAASMANKYNMEFACSEADEIFTNSSINSLIIATRHDSHADYVIRGLENDKAIYVEKPLATCVEDLNAIRDIMDRKSKEGKSPFLMVGFNRRFSPLAVTLRNVFRHCKAPLAMVYRVNAGSVAQTEWVHDPVQGGGRVVGEVCHFVDFMSFLAGESPSGVSATAVNEKAGSIADTVTVTLDFPGGSMGTIHYFANGNPSLPKEYIEVYGGGVCARLVNFRSLKVFGAKAPGKTNYMNQVKGFDQTAASFVQAVRAGLEMPIPFESLYATTLTTFAVPSAVASSKRISVE